MLERRGHELVETEGVSYLADPLAREAAVGQGELHETAARLGQRRAEMRGACHCSPR